MIILTIEMDVPGSKTKELLQTLLEIAWRMRIENGCIVCDVLRDVEDEHRYRLVGKWKRQDDLNRHLRSKEFGVLRGAMNLLQKQPEIRVDVVYRTKEIDGRHKPGDRHKK